MGLKSDKLLDDACQKRVACQFFCSEVASLSSFKSKSSVHQKYAISGTTQNPSSSSSQDSSGNSKTKSALKAYGFEGIAMLSEVATVQATSKDQPSFKQKEFCSNRISLNKRKRKNLECNADDTSCIIQSQSPKMMVDYNLCSMDRSVSHGSGEVNISVVCGDMKTTNVQKTPDCFGASHEVGNEHKFFYSPSKFSKSSSQKVAPFSSGSEASEISLPRDALTYTNTAEPSETNMDEVKSSMEALITAAVEEIQQQAFNNAESVITFEKNSSTNIRKCADQYEDLGNQGNFSMEHNPLDHSIGQDLMVDVKVCDICGDVGREDVLAICSKCSDGAEHIYCMQVKLDEVPEGDWVCEECILLEETKKLKQNKCEKAATLSSGGATTCLGLNIRSPDVKYRRQNNYSSVKGHATRNLNSSSLIKRRVSEASTPLSKLDGPDTGSHLTQKSPFKANNSPLSKEKYYKHIPANASLPANSKCNTSKFRQCSPMFSGKFSKSKSFNIANVRLKVQKQEENSPKQNISKNIAATDKKEDGHVRMIGKSPSLNGVSYKHLSATASKSKMASPRYSDDGLVKRLGSCSSDMCKVLSSSVVASASIEVASEEACGSDAILQVPVHIAGNEENLDRSTWKILGLKSWDELEVTALQANPQPDYIWRGRFEVRGNQMLSSFCCCVQAHLSCLASTKVLEVVKQFPSKLCLEEAPRSSVWPIQFLENHPTEENIALYFYAKDVVSYENYKTLVECMNHYDLALRQNFDGVELLIFSSNLLPKNSKRWNSLFFLWGVFKVKRANHTDIMPSQHKSTPVPALNRVITGQAVSISSEERTSSRLSREYHASASTLPCHVKQSFNSIDQQQLPRDSSGREDGHCQSQACSPEQNNLKLHTNFVQDQCRGSKKNAIMVQEKQFCHDTPQPNAMKEDRVFEKEREDFNAPSKESCKGATGSQLILEGNEKHDSKAKGISTYVATPPSYGHCSAGALLVKPLEWQMQLSDHKNGMHFEDLDLELSLGMGRKPSDPGFMSSFMDCEKEKTGHHADENSLLELSLTLRCYGK